ncbi:hypothetical protein [Desulfovibrio sp. ZJ369]|uniref:hypothetical protein n=1 Tax=Desulfovibrio sp. ZJ369 TaxID=2709793 RepID=UPI0013E9A7ED|nr:hypothetical protein [Desulfovibrio sp. ZJ369]
MNINASILYVGGSKCGVGKSKGSFALINYLPDDGKRRFWWKATTPDPTEWSAAGKNPADPQKTNGEKAAKQTKIIGC